MNPRWFTKLQINHIWAKALQFDLDPNIIAAIVNAESRGFVYAVRYEPNYRWLWYPKKFASKQIIDEKTERNLQKQSYGLMQIMGATARWRGFKGSLPALYKPENNLYWGCNYFSYLLKKFGNYEDAVSAYNQGTVLKKLPDGRYKNHVYVDEVYSYYKELV